jgi:hypothetical protein
MYVEADVALVRANGLARVDSHANKNRPCGEDSLALGSGCGCIRSLCERDEDRVALRVDLDAAVRGKRVS